MPATEPQPLPLPLEIPWLCGMIRMALESPAPLDPLQQLALTVGDVEHALLCDVLEAIADHHAEQLLRRTFTGRAHVQHGNPRIAARARAASAVIRHLPGLWFGYIGLAARAKAIAKLDAN